ncbi:TRAP transporter small permease [Microbacterium soli]|uniref:Tripartite ATP-independent periplasmic transporters DctQ component domain-containing protein n=1 Tax=Microbacterium soli TaxID=446075 RepID=A0ABP7NA57_9MICO
METRVTHRPADRRSVWTILVDGLVRATGVIDRVQVALCAVLLFALFVVIINGVMFRYVLNSSLVWSDELARIVGIWVVFLGIACAHRRNEHVSVSSVLRFIPGIRARNASRIGEMITLGLCVVITIVGTMATVNNFTVGQITPALQLPIGIAYAAIPVGFGTMALQSVVRLLAPGVLGMASDSIGPDAEGGA